MHAPSMKSSETQLECKGYGDEVVSGLRNLQQNDELCDFTICAESKSIRVHKVLLAATSEYFRAMLRVYMRETKEDSVELQGLSASSLQTVIDFIYSGRMTLTLGRLPDVVASANRLQVRSALDVCSDYIISLVNFSNADELVHRIADTYSLTRVTEFYHGKVLSQWEDFTSSALFLDLLVEQFLEYLSDDRLRIRSEHLLLDAIMRWIGHDNTPRSASIDSLISLVRLGLSSKAQLTDLASRYATIVNQSVSLARSIQAGFRYHSAAAIRHPPVGDYCRVRASEPSLVLVHSGSAARQFEIIAYDETTSKFHHLAVDTTGCRDCRVVVVDDFLYVVRVVDAGGGTLVGSLLRFDPRHLDIIILPSCKHLRLDPAVVATDDGRIYVFGGCVDVPHGASGNTVLKSVECYTVSTNIWTELSELPLPVHSHAACFVPSRFTWDGSTAARLAGSDSPRGTIYISGGVTAPGGIVTAAVMTYDLSTDTYAPRTAMNCPRRLHEMAAQNNNGTIHIYVLGGINSHTFHNAQTQIPIECYDVLVDQWTILNGDTLAGRSIGHFLIHPTVGILSLGREHLLATEEDIWRYDVDKNVWSPWTRAPARASLAATTGAMLRINFYDEKVASRVIPDRR